MLDPRSWARTVAAAVLLAGCAQIDLGNAARRRAALSLECEEESVEVTAIGAYRFRGEGCGGEVTVACTAGALEPQCYRESALATTGGEPQPPPEAAGELEARIRGGLESRRDDVLACVGRDRVAVRVTYDAEGHIDLSLQGALHGSPEERCVQAALEGVRVAATGASGVVVHLVD